MSAPVQSVSKCKEDGVLAEHVVSLPDLFACFKERLGGESEG